MRFPSLTFKRDDIVPYYLREEFGCFVFQFRLSTTYDSEISSLVCYAMSLTNQPMHPDPIFLNSVEEYVSFDLPINLANLTLAIPDLQKIIGDKENVNEFSVLRLTPVRESQDYIAYDIFTENITAARQADASTEKAFSATAAAPSDRINPCPPLRCRQISL